MLNDEASTLIDKIEIDLQRMRAIDPVLKTSLIVRLDRLRTLVAQPTSGHICSSTSASTSTPALAAHG